MCVSSLILCNSKPTIVFTLYMYYKCMVKLLIKHIFITDDFNSFDFYHQAQVYKHVSTP